MIKAVDNENLQNQINALAPWWENIDFGSNIKTGPGRNKAILWDRYLKGIDKNSLRAKSVLDMGCNAGGNLIELSKFEPARLTGIEGNPLSAKQAIFVLDYFKIPAELIATN